MHATIELLRHLGHRLKLVQKLRQQLEASPQLLDLAKAAKLLTDVNAVSREADFAGIAAAEADEAFLQQAAAQIHDQAQVRSKHVEIVSTGLQVKAARHTQMYSTADRQCLLNSPCFTTLCGAGVPD